MGWINFGGGDLAAELREIRRTQAHIIRNQEYIMALVSVDQTVLDAIGTELSSVADAVQALVDDDSNDLGPADLGGITGAVERIQNALTTPETPVEPAPETDPEA